ncbi:hypothetical protein FisN_10Hh084 [Fistulifera solaris]|uniref:Ribosomal RNA-processing protein 14/surfeit locus protein 6 C-terminal domain-containing protein n=1 Tax=Fistulifera solaris TaxID=1519565 RepID=A0A1Z5JXV6_FISSO|nr:hypothetical protein FisN_10Hh084 [Fistulifera solaris]|eukprot:GAX18702.1 hypothetical protein FisN_10Hh084 [Fistulifera solaris]
MGISSRQMLSELKEHNDFFDMIVDMIPSKLYIAGQSGDDFNPKNPYYRGVTEGSKEARKAAAKAGKRRKLDPEQAETTTRKKEQLESEKFVARDDEDDAEEPEDSRVPEPVVSPHQSRIEALRAKLQAKIASQQGQRPSNPDQVSKRAARRAEKQKRQEEAAKRKKASSSKVDTRDNKTNYRMGSTVDPAEDLAKLDFGRLAGLNKAESSNYLAANKALGNLSKTKNLKKMLADAEAKQQKLEQLKKGTEEDKAKAMEMQWSDTLKEADGQRVKSDPSKIKKVLKRKAAKKAKSQKAWKTRLEQVKEKKDERQTIRNHNLDARKKGGAIGANLSKKKIVKDGDQDSGKRLSRAGFEGKKRDFLNSPKKKGQ